MVRIVKLSVAATATLLVSSSAVASGDTTLAPESIEVLKNEKPKQELRGNMTLKYNALPSEVDSIGDLFSQGLFYGRLRANAFNWDWSGETDKLHDDNAMGIGGSLIYKTAYFSGFGATIGLYTSQNPGFYNMDTDEVKFVKAGKDTFSRLKVKQTGNWGMSVLGQAYLEYKNKTFDIIAGRQLFESVFTASNDTKMIPNTFDGVSASAKVYDKSRLRVAYFTAQKLRDHTTSHDVITFKDESGEKWANNDDAAAHRGLSYENFIAAGEDPDHDLIVADFQTKAIKNLKANLSYLQVPGVVKDLVLEAHYKVPFENGWAVRPGFRYFYQMDDGGGAVAGDNNLFGKSLEGYDSSVLGSLDGDLFMARLDLLMPEKKGFFRVGYSKVGDKADIVAPWRGFPTGGFTRAMAQYNWLANTETILIRGVYKPTSDLTLSLRYAIQDFDDDKNVFADSTVWHFDIVDKLTKEFYIKGRLGIVDADPANTGKIDTSYNEYRLELNYLF
ncbi:hypothetical protein MNB_SV-6-323 [hydrothermal vent metagenome]|uniref:Outer membrane porin, OprD family n=1 Tax=hydrothermal vent metagenome TaxID=652676 RepID=A0A1W1CGC9_9ZZZZ